MRQRITLEQALSGYRPAPFTDAEWHALHAASRREARACQARDRAAWLGDEIAAERDTRGAA